MPGRTWMSTVGGYRYSHNGQEKENEIAEGLLSAEYWMYDSRILRRWETDPVVKEWESPYATFNNNPVLYADPSGLDGKDKGKNDKGKSGGGNNGEKITTNPDGSTSSTVTWEGGGSCTVTNPKDPNTPKGRLNITFNAQHFHKIGGNGGWNGQNDNGYVYPWFPNFTTFNPDESSGRWEVSYAIRSKQMQDRLSLNTFVGLGLTRIKGDLLDANKNVLTHFGHGLGTVGPLARADAEYRAFKGIFFKIGMDISGGTTLSDFGDGISQGALNVSFLDRRYPDWSTHGMGIS
ncbi:MAG: hypothetical protein IT239_03355, partial [Bacteroidia bacterium]|nr:hypothetical protein [Bacteroidia bacterium]